MTADPKPHHPPATNRARPAPERDQPNPPLRIALAVLCGGIVLAGGLAALRARGRAPGGPRVKASRIAAGGAGLLAASVLADSGMEHARAHYKNRAMTVAPTAAAAALSAALTALAAPEPRRARQAIFAGAGLAGLIGTGFHLYNIQSRIGGFSWNNLFYRAPFGAPGALVLAGAFGLLAARAAGGDPRAGARLAGATAAGLFGLTAEVGLLHFRGAFHNPLMYAPVIAVPLTGAAVSLAALRPGSATLRAARYGLWTTTALGLAGTGLHAYGVSRNMGGFANWTQTLFQGPPIAAPPSLAGLALAGEAAMRLLEEREEI